MTIFAAEFSLKYSYNQSVFSPSIQDHLPSLLVEERPLHQQLVSAVGVMPHVELVLGH